MALHHRAELGDTQLDSVFASAPTCRARCPSTGSPPTSASRGEAFQLVSDELLLDGNARQNLATFCQTWEEPEVHRLMDLAIDKNQIDKDEYPQTAEIERRCVHMLADLWNAPDAANTVGTSAIGSSEACMLGGMAAKWRWRARRAAAGKPADRPNMVCGPVQVVWHKFARYWDIEMREVPMAPGALLHGRRVDARAGRREHHLRGAHLRRHLHRRLRAGAGAVRGPRRPPGATPGSTSTSTSTGPAAPSWPRSAPPTSSSTSGCRGSSRSAPRATSSASPRSGWAGWSGATRPSCPTT